MLGAPNKQIIDGVMVYGVPLETMTAWKLHGLFDSKRVDDLAVRNDNLIREPD